MKYRLGEGWSGDLTTGEDIGGQKYADLGIYCGHERVLGLGISHWEIRADGDLAEMRPKLVEMIRRLNERDWDNAAPPRDIRTEAEVGLVKALGVSREIAHKLVNSGINCLAACEGTEASDFLGMGFTESETLGIVDGLRKAGV